MWDTGTNWPASAGSWLVHLRSIGIGYGYGVAKEVPKGETWAQTSGLGILGLAGRWLLYENGEFERIRPHLMPLECGIIFDGIPEGAISRKVGLIWGIPAKVFILAGKWPLWAAYDG